LPAWDESQVENADEQVVIAHNWDELRLLMWNYVGIVRTTKRLERALHRIELLRAETLEYYANFRVTRDLLELRNLVDCAELIVKSAPGNWTPCFEKCLPASDVRPNWSRSEGRWSRRSTATWTLHCS
jgi:succinate dehydrogenase/fumarate reductase flavoprotein subunit